MRLLDRIALNQLVSRLFDLILTIAKMFAPKKNDETPVPSKPKKRRRIFPNLNIGESTDE